VTTDKFIAPKLIASMFEIIDSCRWDELDAVFARDCVYERPGFEPIAGIAALREFYARHRPIERGTHHVESVISEGSMLCATGSFDGALRDGSAIRLRFSDLYRTRFDHVVWRTTFFFTPLA
jgi:ketosteroid isomerase-like protein